MSASPPWAAEGLDEAALGRLASKLVLVLHPGDCVTLSGELGAGKTTFARALIGHIWGAGAEAEEIVSPTFALAETYPTPRMEIAHFDCFRLERPGEAEELGIEEALEGALVLIEWPERIAELLPADRLGVRLEEEETGARRISLEGHGTWEGRLERFAAMAAFLEVSGWGEAEAAYLQGDASPRRYARLVRGAGRALLMDAPRRPDGPPIREGKPYSALAHLAEDVRPFVAVDEALRRAGLSAPEIFATDLERGFLILEDLGDEVFDRLVTEGRAQDELYGAAVEVLLELRAHPPERELALAQGGTCALAAYDETALSIEVELLLDWFWPALKGEEAPEIVRVEFKEAWGAQFAFLAAQRRGWVLRDYHSPNLIWLAGREGLARVGVIDFQDALRGPHAYDLVSLLQDARVDVSADLEEALLEKYCRACESADPTFERARFLAAYATAGAQRNTKILGIFARLAARDGKRGYLGHIPRVSAYLERNLGHEALGPLRAWYDRHLPAAERARFDGA